MQSVWRSLRHLKCYTNISRATQGSDFSVTGRSDHTEFLTCTSIKYVRLACSLLENKKVVPTFSPYPNGAQCCNILGWVAPVRRLTTATNPEVSIAEDGTTSSSDVIYPPRIKFKRLDKTAKNIMNILDKEAVEEVRAEREIPDIKPGHIIQLKVEVPENKRRISILKGIVIARRNAGLNTTFRLRRLVAGVGVESVFPLYSPNIKEMKVLDKKKVRRAKLYYLRDRMNPLKK